MISSKGGQLDGLCFLVAYQLNSLFIFMMLFLFNVQLRNKYDDDDDDDDDVLPPPKRSCFHRRQLICLFVLF